MKLELNEQERQLLKNVLHALYKTFRREPGLNIGTCQCTNIYPEDVTAIIAIHDRLSAVETEEKPEEQKTVIDKAIAYVREWLQADELAEIRAQVDRSYRYRMAPSDCVIHTDRVIDLLAAYGIDHEDVSLDHADDWWSPHTNLDDILIRL